MTFMKRAGGKKNRAKGAAGVKGGTVHTLKKVQISANEEMVDEMQNCDLDSSPNVSQTLGDCDTDMGQAEEKDSKLKESSNINGAHQLVDKISEPDCNSANKSWTSLFQENRKIEEGHQLLEHKGVDKNAEIDEVDLLDLDNVWGYALIGYVAGKFPGRQNLLDRCCSKWGVPYTCHQHTNGWLVFQFDTAADRDSVLQGGPYFIFTRPLLLKLMPEFFQFGDEEISICPVWVQLKNLPLKLWSASSLGKIASKIGKPIATDKLTRSMERISYARVLLEVDVQKDLVYEVGIRLPNGVTLKQTVEYEFEPQFCDHCKILGHKWDNCSWNPEVYNKAANVEADFDTAPKKKPVDVADPSKDGGQAWTEVPTKHGPKPGNGKNKIQNLRVEGRGNYTRDEETLAEMVHNLRRADTTDKRKGQILPPVK